VDVCKTPTYIHTYVYTYTLVSINRFVRVWKTPAYVHILTY